MCNCVYYNIENDACELPITKGCPEWFNISHGIKPRMIDRSIPKFLDREELCNGCVHYSSLCRLGPGHSCQKLVEIKI